VRPVPADTARSSAAAAAAAATAGRGRGRRAVMVVIAQTVGRRGCRDLLVADRPARGLGFAGKARTRAALAVRGARRARWRSKSRWNCDTNVWCNGKIMVSVFSLLTVGPGSLSGCDSRECPFMKVPLVCPSRWRTSGFPGWNALLQATRSPVLPRGACGDGCGCGPFRPTAALRSTTLSKYCGQRARRRGAFPRHC